MPIFEFSCSGCNNKFEELMTSTESSVNCPECGSPEVSKEFSVFAATTGRMSSAIPCGAQSCVAPPCGSGFS